MSPICADESCVFIHYKPTEICLKLHLTALRSPQLGLISFVLRTNVVSFFFHMTMWLLIKQPRMLGMVVLGVMCYLTFLFFLSDI